MGDTGTKNEPNYGLTPFTKSSFEQTAPARAQPAARQPAAGLCFHDKQATTRKIK